MELLLDTCTLLWWAAGAPQLSTAMASALRNPGNRVYLSAASSWEIAIKHASGRLQLPDDPRRYVPHLRQYYMVEPLAIGEADALQAGQLPPLHRDPFDRMLVAQSIEHGMKLVTPDPAIHRYPVATLWL